MRNVQFLLRHNTPENNHKIDLLLASTSDVYLSNSSTDDLIRTCKEVLSSGLRDVLPISLISFLHCLPYIDAEDLLFFIRHGGEKAMMAVVENPYATASVLASLSNVQSEEIQQKICDHRNVHPSTVLQIFQRTPYQSVSRLAAETIERRGLVR